MKKIKTIAVKIFLSQLLISVAYAQSGSLDLSFDTDGRVTTSIGTFDDAAKAVKIQNDGKIVVAGFTYGVSDYDFALVRYNTNGSIDSTFGSNGVVTTAIQSSHDKVYCLAMQNDGKIIAAGYSYAGTKDWVALVRYNTNGSIDTTFNHTGIVTTLIGNNDDYVNAIAIQNDGKIVVTGGTTNANTFNIFAARYNTDGKLDSTFDGDGINIIDLAPNKTDIGNDIAIQNDDKIVIAGYTTNGNQTDFALIRLTNNGSLDNTFDTDGIVSHGIVGAFNETATALALQTDGKIVAAGSSNNSFYDFVITRYNSNGGLDTTFNTDGIAVTDLGTLTDFGVPLDIALQSDNKIIAAGYQNVGTSLNFSIIRYNPNGSIDNTFDTDGIVTTDFSGSGDDQGSAVAIQSDGKIIVAGANYDSQNKIALARYNNAITTGVTNKEKINYAEVAIAPNPLNSFASIQTKNNFNNAQLTIINMNGELVKHIENINGNLITLDTSELSSGIYFIKFYQASTYFQTYKIVVSN